MTTASCDEESAGPSEKYEKLERLIALADLLRQQSSFEEILRLVTQKAAALLHAHTALIMMINPQTRHTVKTVVRNGQLSQDREYHSVQRLISGWMIRHKKPLLSQEVRSDPRFKHVKFDDLPITSAIAVLLQMETATIGSLIVIREQHGAAFTDDDLAYLQKLAVIATPYLHNIQSIQQFFAGPLPKSALLSKYEKSGLWGKSKKFIQLLQTIESATRCDVRVLLEGESGTGKELIARAIHKFSARSSGPFIAIDCGAIPEHLIESELFGHVKGAFTGAVADRKGLLEEADRGTLFMDEIASLPMDMQSKFIRVLQEGEVRPVGSNRTHKINVRIISASSRSLQQLVAAQQFREDLFYRLYVYPIHVPSLNERGADIPLLANFFLRRFAGQQQKQAAHFGESLMEAMQQRKWSGNVRELENFVERLVALAPSEIAVLDYQVLPADVKNEFQRLKTVLPDDDDSARSLAECLAEYEEQLIRKALLRSNWNQSQAARALKVSVQNLRQKMARLGIVQVDKARA